MRSRALAGVLRSLRMYHGDRAREAAMDRLYARYLGTGDLAFDIGAHVGDRVSSFRRLGCRVIALEPLPLCQRLLRLIHGRDPQVSLVTAAAGSRCGRALLHVNRANPTVCTLSAEFVRAARGAPGWEGQEWDAHIEVPVVTLDRLVATHGAPRFVKIDVEGSEPEVLRGLTCRVPALSFEFTTIRRQAARDCLALLQRLGDYRFDVALGESQQLEFGRPVAAKKLAAWLDALPDAANSGDVYAVLPQKLVRTQFMSGGIA
jgi:FkbM family methyltransferase